MALTIRKWLQSIDLPLLTSQTMTVHKPIKAPDLNDLAFELATADQLSERLPRIIENLQMSLNDLFTSRQRCDLLVIFSMPETSETYVHHAQQNQPHPKLLQSLHREFTKNTPAENELLTISHQSKHWQLLAKRILRYDKVVVWLLCSFDDKVPDSKKINWALSPIEQGLMKGIYAWYQREQRVKNALQTERSIYAAELHDSLAQVLGYLRIKSAKLDKLCQQEPYKELQPITEDLRSYTLCAYRQTRELITSSRITMQTDNLAEGVINSINEFKHQSAIFFELDNRMRINTLSPKQSLQILYIIRESLSNIVRHSHATYASILLNPVNSNQLEVVIEDNGIGIEPSAARRDSFGMQIMRERAERIGGSLSITNRDQGGSQTRLLLNVEDSSES